MMICKNQLSIFDLTYQCDESEYEHKYETKDVIILFRGSKLYEIHDSLEEAANKNKIRVSDIKPHGSMTYWTYQTTTNKRKVTNE